MAMIAAGSDVVFVTTFYFLFVICLVFPPTEFVSAGLTISNIFDSWLGSEDVNFVQHHIKRTALSLLIHSCLPLGYVFCLGYTDSPGSFADILNGNVFWNLYCVISLGAVIAGITVTYTWQADDWSKHPIVKLLQKYARGTATWKSVATDIDVEFRRVDKICIRTSAISRIVATDNWIIKVTPYTLHVVHQSDVTLNIVSSDQHNNPVQRAQYLNILVQTQREGISSFMVRINSLDLRDLQDKCSRPIQNVQNIIIQQSLSDQFLETFREQVKENGAITVSDELDNCIGCMQTMANVKLERRCESAGRPEGCVNCYCRPMWCIDCMGKWFASRQDQNKPETWLGSPCPCPTCRSRFCMLDVCLIERPEL